MVIFLQQLNECLKDIIQWMIKYTLKMNNSKTEIIVYGTKQQFAKVNISSENVDGIEVKCVDHLRDLGVLMENNRSFDKHIRKKCQIAHVQLRNLKGIRQHLSKINCDLGTWTNSLTRRFLQWTIFRYSCLSDKHTPESSNQAARIVTSSLFDQPSTEILKALHWLVVKARIIFKILVIDFRIVQGTALTYIIWDLCSIVFWDSRDGIRTPRPYYHLVP